MAILDGLKNAVAANVARSANNVAVNGLHSLVGDVFGVDLSTNPAGKLTNRPTKWTTKSLAYPAGVEGDDMQGHYIIFEILTQNKAKLTAAKNKKDALAAVVASETDRSATLASMTSAQKKANEAVKNYNDIASKKTDDGIRSLSGGKNSIQLSNKATVKIDTQIALYMPPSISVQYESKYGDQNISGIAAAAAGAIDAFTGKNGTSAETALKGALDELGMGLETGLMKVLETAAPGATALLALEKGAVRTPKMELMFEGIGRRRFSYEFTFIPKDAAEAETIKEIVKQFKFHMASNYSDTTFREMEIPSFFNILYKYRNADNDYLNKISTCALEKMDVSYGGDRFVSYEGGVPQTTKISLNFVEMEIITKSAIEAGA
jgi:hypothetical protein|tara:strand:- start:93 stop:1226 length:1134 start_codon:yes stop_codon:yes gene_type:complete